MVGVREAAKSLEKVRGDAVARGGGARLGEKAAAAIGLGKRYDWKTRAFAPRVFSGKTPQNSERCIPDRGPQGNLHKCHPPSPVSTQDPCLSRLSSIEGGAQKKEKSGSSHLATSRRSAHRAGASMFFL